MSVRIGLIGCGPWGLNYLRTFSELDGSRVIAACDVNADRLSEAQRRLPELHIASDPQKLLDQPELDAVVVATEASSHFAVAQAALEAGKDCLVEKPLTIHAEDAIRLRELARLKARILMVGHVFRYNSAINYLQRLLAAGALGDLEYLYFTRTNLGPIRSDVNVVWDLMTHDVSILLHFLNQHPAWVSAQGASYLRRACEDVAFATLGFANGVIANIRASWLDPRKVREITLVGTGKMAVFNDLDSTEPVRIYDKGAMREPSYQSFGEFKLVTRSGDVVIPAISASEPLKIQCRHFLDSIATRRPPLSDAEDGLRVVEIIAAINQSVARKGVPVPLVSAVAEAA